MMGLKTDRYFSWRLGALYQRLSQSPWRRVILYIGSSDLSLKKCDPKKISYMIYTDRIKNPTTPAEAVHILLDPLEECCSLPFEDGAIDMIICHLNGGIKDYRGFLKECFRILDQQGKLIWTINNSLSPYYCFHPKKELSLWEVQHLLEVQSFEILKTISYDFSISFFKLSRFWLRALKKFSQRWYIQRWSTKITFVIIKNKEKYCPIPIYEKIARQLLPLQLIRTGDCSTVLESSKPDRVFYPNRSL